MSQSTDIHTLAGAYALDALTEIERAAFARHIAACDACATEVAELAETASRLGSAVAQPPPARLREAVLAEVSRTRQVSAGRPAKAGTDSTQRWRRFTAAAVAAAVLGIAGTATVWAVQEARVDDAQRLAEQVAADQARISAVLAAPDVRIRSTTVAGGGTVTVALAPSLDDGAILVSGLPAPGADKAYQLWLLRGAAPTSAGVMAADAGAGAAVVHGIAGVDTIGVTVEPAGGSASPTLPVVVGVAVT